MFRGGGKKVIFWKGQARNMQEFKAPRVEKKIVLLLGENMSNIKLESDTAPCNFNRVLPCESIIRLSDFKMGIETIIIPQCWNSSVLNTVWKISKWNLIHCLSFSVLTVFTVVALCLVAVNKLQAHRLEKAFICLACIIVPGAEAENDCDTMPVINISGARQVRTTNLTE